MAAEPGFAERKGSKTKPAKKVVESVTIEKAENGYTARCSHSYTGDGPMAYEPAKNYVFEDLEKAVDFAKTALGAGKK